MRMGSALALVAVAILVMEPRAQPLTSGLDVAGFDLTVRPQDDPYRYVNGGWLDRTAMPADRVSYGAFAEIADRTELDLRAIIDEIRARPSRPRGSAAQQIADLYASVLDEARLDQLGAAAIEPELRRIEAIRSTRDVAAEAGHLSSIAAGGPFGGTVGIDPQNPGAPVARVTQGGILLPDRDYYLSADPALVDVRSRYRQYLARIFELTGRATATDEALAVLQLETSLARALWTEAESRDINATNTRFTLRQLSAEMPGFDWAAWAKPQGLDRSPVVILAQPSFFKAFAALVPMVPLQTWKAWLVSRYVTAAAPYLSTPFDEARFDFFGSVLTGQQRPRVRWKRGVSMVNAYLGDAIGKLYVEKHFPPSARARVRKMLVNILEAYRDAIRGSDWMSPRTRREALDKLAALSTGVGQPARWRNYNTLVIKPDDLLGNWQRAIEFDSGYRLANVGGAPSGEWMLPPQTVNAYYRPAANEMVVPAAILQPPLFDVTAEDAVNYGAAGALFGHEIGHAFDDRGRRFDGTGAVRDWWTPADERGFNERASGLVQQLNAYEPLPGLHVNGTLASAETLGDLGGLSIAFRAYKLSLKGGRSPTIDGLTGEQRLFMGWARMWRSKERDEYVRSILQSSPYLPSAFRANAAVGNVNAFYEAFDVKPDDRLYRPPAARVRIW
ncbi:MAG TPA: M13-type metalloendopeptidase [Vicinamibacterales bacterium]|nr:M13-type metalloendopeptidase [Vicinamibacterales bacterium]